jgi:lipopolysaccharide/colanic/teichoic acid biosynthesis glycosyltransferase
MHYPERSLEQDAGFVGQSGASQDRLLRSRLFRGQPLRGLYRRHFKRGFDILAVIASLPLVLPVIAALALVIKRDGGPVFYSHDRIGRNGETFRFWKLRSMVVDADRSLAEHLRDNPEARAEWEASQKLRNDPRVTRIGRFIRKSSLDELPQLWNILRGDMSLVGPRPMMPEQRALYHGRAYYQLRPGLTGFWQIGDRNDTTFAARAVYDTHYARSLSFPTDMAVLLLTVRTVLRGTGR